MPETLDNVLSSIEKEHGEDAIIRLGESETIEVGAIPTGALSLDMAIGVGGIPRGRVTEIYGPESAGKSTLAQTIIGNAQKDGSDVAYIDVEHALDRGYAAEMGIDVDRMLLSQPNSGEQALDICDALIDAESVSCIVIDSVAALATQAELEGTMGDSHVALQARLMSQALRKITPSVSQSNTAVIFINQLRERVGVVYGNREFTPGGRSLKFYSSVRIELRSGQQIKDGNDVIGRGVKAKIVKNKVAAPFRTAEFDIMYTKPRGIRYAATVLDAARSAGIIKQSGPYFSIGEENIGRGRNAAIEYLENNAEACATVVSNIKGEHNDVSTTSMEARNT